MADRGRDLSFDILSDTSKFDLSEPAKELEDLSDASKQADKNIESTTDELKRLAQQGKDAQRELDRLNAEVRAESFDKLGKDATQTAHKVDSAFDSISRSAKTNFDKVDKETKEVGSEGFQEFSQEAKQNISEVASSFTGDFDSAIDAVQGTLGGLASALGPAGVLGAAVGALGVGLVKNLFQNAADAANAFKDRVIDLAQAVEDVGGDINKVDITGKIKEWTTEIRDNKSWWELWQKDNTTNIEHVSEVAKKFGLDLRDVGRGLSGLDNQAALRTIGRINDQMADLDKQIEAATESSDKFTVSGQHQLAVLTTQRDGLADTRSELIKVNGLTTDAAELQRQIAAVTDSSTAAIERYKEAQEEAATATAAHRQAVEDFTDPAQVFIDTVAAAQTKLDEAAAKTGQAAKTAKVSIADFITALSATVTAQETFQTNLSTLATKGFDEGFIASLEAKGPEAAAEIQALTTASPAQIAAINALWERQARESVTSYITTIAGKKQDVTNAARAVHNAAAEELGKGANLPIHVVPPPTIGPNSSANAAEHAIAEAQAYANNHPITLHVINPASGKGVV